MNRKKNLDANQVPPQFVLPRTCGNSSGRLWVIIAPRAGAVMRERYGPLLHYTCAYYFIAKKFWRDKIALNQCKISHDT